MTAANGDKRMGMGWLILVLVLAVPGFLFFNWWSKLKAEQEKGLAAKSRAGGSETVFQTAPGRAAVPAASAAVARTDSAPAISTASAPSPVSAPKTAPVSLSTAAIPSPAAPDKAPASPATAIAVSSAPTVVLSRDPMMSPLDRQRLREAALEKEREEERKRRAAEAPKTPAKAARKLPPIESRIELQGIVARPDGASLVIVNDFTLSAGQTFAMHGYPGKVKVFRISSSDVTFEYQNRRFKKKVNAE